MKLTSKELKHFVEKNKIENIYLFQGPEIGEKKEIIELIEKKIFGNEETSKFTFFCGDSFNLADFENTLVTNLLFSDKKIVYLKNIEEIDSNTIKFLEDYIIPKKINEEKFKLEIIDKISKQTLKKEFEAIYKQSDKYFVHDEKIKSSQKKDIIQTLYSINYKNYDPNTYLIMVNETNEKIPQALIDLLAQEQNIIFWEMFENQKFDWIRNEFKKRNLFVEEEAVSFIISMIENNKNELSNEINKIIELYELKGDKSKKAIDLIFIEDYLYHSKAESPFSLYSALLNKNLAKALEILESLFLTDELMLLNGLVWAHRRFLKAIDLFENQKMQTFEIFSTLKIISQREKKRF
jgi:DNA polymerase III delta subunit